MKVLHISGARSWGGNEQQLADLVPELQKLGVENFIFGVENSPLADHFKSTSTKFISAKGKKLLMWANLLRLKGIIQEYLPDVIHLHTSDSVTIYVIADFLHNLQVPTVFSKKGMGNSSTYLSIYKYNYKNIRKIICVSKAVQNDMEKIIKPKNHHKLVVVYDGVNLDRTNIKRNEDLRDFFGIKSKDLVLGNIANHSKAKDLGVLVKMMDHIVNTLKITNVHLIQMGTYSKLTEELKSMVAELELNPYITFTGFQNHAMDFISQFNIYVMSSVREGLPITIFEAFYKGCPVVSTRAGGIPEAITDGENGFLAGIKDHKELAEKVVLLLKDQELQEKFVLNSKKIFENRFMANITAENTLEIYKNVNS